MRYSTSREKLSQMHQDLDRQLQMAGFPQRGRPKKDREEFRFVSEANDNKKSTLSNISNKPPLYDYEVREVDIKSKKNQISDLEHKLMELERKMDNFEVSSGEEEENIAKRERLNFNKKQELKPNEDTARFLLNAEEKEKERNHTKFTVEYPSLEDEDQEDSQDYFQIQQAIQKRKAEQKLLNQRKASEKETLRVRLDSRQNRQKYQLREDTERKVMLETETALRPKYSNQKSRRSVKSNCKKSVGKQSNRDSVVSKKSVDKPKGLPRTNSRASIRSGDSLKKSNSKNLSREKLNRSIDRSQKGEQISRGEQIEVAKEIKRTNNLQRQLQHYKRLAQKYKQELQDYKVMEIQFRELKKNFAKSQMIRGQQKKIIDSLKSKINK